LELQKQRLKQAKETRRGKEINAHVFVYKFKDPTRDISSWSSRKSHLTHAHQISQLFTEGI
jgi:hypothetical protein